MHRPLIFMSFLLLGLVGRPAAAEVPDTVLQSAGENRAEIDSALAKVPATERAGMEFLISHMPTRDLTSLSADFLLENSRVAYESRKSDPWAANVPEEVFLNAVLPYASINERRDNWRADFRRRFRPLVADAKTPSEVAAILNQKVFQQLNVKYSTKRNKADQSPYESMEIGLASCTGLSIVLIDACRSVGVPARMVGTPLWSNDSGNHSWVEIWDNGWHFTGAAEPTGNDLDRGWFVNMASKAVRDNPRYAIYASSFRKTPLSFPCVWDPRIRYIPAVNVTDRYTRLGRELPASQVENLFVVKNASGERIAAKLTINRGDETVFEGTTNDDRFDTNDHLRVALAKGVEHTARVRSGETVGAKTITPAKQDTLISFTLKATDDAKPSAAKEAGPTASSATIKELESYLKQPAAKRGQLAKQAFAGKALSAKEARSARKLLGEDRAALVRTDRKEEMESRVIKQGELSMPFAYQRFGDKPDDGWSLYISLHGGGGAPPRVNDSQWENQKRLYKLEEGIYVAPRAPTDTWNLWHQAHIDTMFSRLIENMVAFEDVNWNRVYVMGYSAGGDGVYQLAPRMADRWAAAAMMAGHPNETSPLGLRNVPFALQVGGRDAAYKRNEIGREWGEKLAKLRKDDPDGYEHFVKIYPNKGHWMDREDAVAIPWMAKHTRNPTPKKIVWRQDDVTHGRFYWLGVDEENRSTGSDVVAIVDGQSIDITATKVKRLIVSLDDRFIDLDQPIKITSGGKVLHEGKVNRTIASLSDSLEPTGDPNLSFPASVTVDLPPPFPTSLVPASEIPKVTAKRTAKPLVIDGKLDEAAWTEAARTTSFVDLISGEPTKHDTRAAIVWDDDNLYVGFWVAEPNLAAKYQNRDDPIYYDNDVEVFIAGADAYYEFEVNGYNTIYEGFFTWDDAYEKGGYAADPQLKPDAAKSQPFNGVGLTTHPRGKRTAFLGYDFPGLKSAVNMNGTLNDPSDVDQGWTVELAFPWKSMRWLAVGDGRALPPETGDQWRIDLFRFNTQKHGEHDSGGWALGKHSVWDSHIPEIFPIVTFVE